MNIREVETDVASPLARSLVFDYVAAWIYEGDAPLAERRAQALTLDRNLLRDLLGHAELRELLDPEAIDELCRLGTYLNAKINLINLNPHPSIPYEPVSETTLYAIADSIKSRGLQATIRHPKGQDIVAACGQLGGGSIASM